MHDSKFPRWEPQKHFRPGKVCSRQKLWSRAALSLGTLDSLHYSKVSHFILERERRKNKLRGKNKSGLLNLVRQELLASPPRVSLFLRQDEKFCSEKRRAVGWWWKREKLFLKRVTIPVMCIMEFEKKAFVIFYNRINAYTWIPGITKTSENTVHFVPEESHAR